jgi:hypothetical protein
LASLNERAIGYFLAGGLLHGSTVYVTTDRIIVNKGRGQLSLKAHMLTTCLLLFGPLVPPIMAVAIILAIPALIAFSRRRRGKSRRKWATIGFVESGHRQLEVSRGQLLGIELKPPQRWRSGHVVIVSLSSEPFDLKVFGGRVFKGARSLMMRYEASKVKFSDPAQIVI